MFFLINDLYISSCTVQTLNLDRNAVVLVYLMYLESLYLLCQINSLRVSLSINFCFRLDVNCFKQIRVMRKSRAYIILWSSTRAATSAMENSSSVC